MFSISANFALKVQESFERTGQATAVDMDIVSMIV